MHVNMKTFRLTQTMGAWLVLWHYLLEMLLFSLRFLACFQLLLLWISFTPSAHTEIFSRRRHRRQLLRVISFRVGKTHEKFIIK